MHITTETEGLKKALEKVSRVSTKHITLPVLQCVLIKVKSMKVFLTATNLEIGVEVIVSAEVEEEGTVAVSADTLLRTVSLINQKKITLYTEGETLHIETKTSKTEIKTVATDDFPNIPKAEGEEVLIKGSMLALGIKTTAFSASQSSIKPELGSIYIHHR